MSREAMLAGIRAALGAASADGARRRAVDARLVETRPHLVPERVRRSHEELIELFKAHLAAQSVDLVEVGDREQIPGAVAAYLAAQGLPARVRCGNDPYLELLACHEVPRLVVETGAAHADDTAGLSHAVAGVAETGTLVLASGPHNPVTLAFVPDTHIVVVRASTIVGTYEQACTVADERLPRTLNLVSGPSRTGDIGGRIVMGAHGPRRLAVILVADD
jgi:L-lactate dehydrogenase complex protein LldG